MFAVLIILLLAAASCTSSSSSATDGAGDPGRRPKSLGKTEAGAGAPGESENGGNSGASPFGPEVTATGRFAGGVGLVRDPAGDAQVTGVVPDFVEILEGSVEGSRHELALGLRMSGEVPQTMPDETTHLIVAWNLAASKKAPTIGISAQAGIDGWVVSAAIDNKPTEWPGELTIEGDRIILTVPWNFVDTPHSFGWSAAASYYGTDGGEATGSADNIPEGHFPDEARSEE